MSIISKQNQKNPGRNKSDSISHFVSFLILQRLAIHIIKPHLNIGQVGTEKRLAIKSRLKSPVSIIEKLLRKDPDLMPEGMEESIEKNLYDVAGIRVICAFQEDIYSLADLLIQQDDIRLIRTKDYIKNPKPNGYRSLHLILEVPVFLKSGKTPVKVEVQFRTIAMDFWASVDHKLRYKKNLPNEEEIVEKLRQCANVIAGLDNEMQEIRSMIETGDQRQD